jgi:hypothetical protein
VPPVKLIFELEVPLFSNCRVLVNLIVPLTVMMSPAFALAMAVFKADSVVTVVFTALTTVCVFSDLRASEEDSAVAGCSVTFKQLAKRSTSAARALICFFILEGNLIVKKKVLSKFSTCAT